VGEEGEIENMASEIWPFILPSPPFQKWEGEKQVTSFSILQPPIFLAVSFVLVYDYVSFFIYIYF
jgi:hypothetical protein